MIELLEAIVEPHTHAAVDAEVIVRSVDTGGGCGGDGRLFAALSWVTCGEMGVHHGGEVKGEVVGVVVRVSWEGVPRPRMAIVMICVAVHSKQARK